MTKTRSYIASLASLAVAISFSFVEYCRNQDQDCNNESLLNTSGVPSLVPHSASSVVDISTGSQESYDDIPDTSSVNQSSVQRTTSYVSPYTEYTIQSGDTLNSLLKRAGFSPVETNTLVRKSQPFIKPHMLKIGQTVRVRLKPRLSCNFELHDQIVQLCQ